MPIKINDKIYVRIQYSKESDFEKDIVDNADDIFGEKTIYVDMKKKVKGNGVGVIPDAYLIDLTVPEDPKMYVVENEISSHDIFNHIGSQILRFSVSFGDERVKIRNSIMEKIHSSNESKRRLEEGCSMSEFRNIDQYLDKAVYGKFRALILIDEVSDKLHKVLTNITVETSVIKFKKFKSGDGDIAYEFETLYDEDIDPVGNTSTSTQELTKEALERRRERLASSDTIIVPARPDGFETEFLGNNRWYAIRISPAMKDRIKYIAAYQVSPISAVTHIGEIQEIKLWEDSGKYVIILKGNPEEIDPIKINDKNRSPQSSVYVKREDLYRVDYLEEALN